MPFDNPRRLTSEEAEALTHLRAARALIADQKNWTTGVRKTPREDGGYAFCALGALDNARGIDSYDDWYAVQQAQRALPVGLLARHAPDLPGTAHLDRTKANDWRYFVAMTNNNAGHARTLQMFDSAIAELEALDS